MTSFSQWYNSFRSQPKVRQFTWVTGTERILVQDVVDRIKNEISPEPWNLVVLDASEVSERVLWSELQQFNLGLDSTRLIIVNSAEKLNSERVIGLIKDRKYLVSNRYVFVSNEDLPRKSERPEELEAFRSRSLIQFIECRPFTEATAHHAVRWVQESANVSSQVAAHLLNRATGDLRLVRDVIAKLKVFPDQATTGVINAMLAERPNDTFIDALFALDRKTAIKALSELPRSEWSRTLGLIDARLDLAGLVHDQQLNHKTPGEIARAAGSKSFLVPEMLPVAKYYDTKRRQKIRDLLSVIDEYTETGIPDGAFEALVTFW